MSSSDSDVLVLVDNPSLSLGGPHWSIEPAGPLLGGTQYIYQNVAPYGSIVYDFSGTGISFVGNGPGLSDAASPKSFNVSIDSNALYVAKFQFPSGINQWYHQFYQSPLLLDGKHSINLSSIVTGVDYAVVTAGQTTPLSGTTILVDDDNPEITYSGSGWQRNTDLIQVGGGYLDAEPVGNATHRSATVGDSFSFQFSGTSVALYGVFDWTETGKMSVVFTLDGRNTTQDFIAAAGVTAPYQQQNHFLLFEQADLQATSHTVSTTITYADGNRDLIFDYITYIAAFSSLATKPKFTSSLATSSVQSSTATSTSSPSPAPKKSSGAIVGGSIAAVVVFLIALFAIFFFIRRRRSRNSAPNADHPSSFVSDPFSENRLTIEPFVPPSSWYPTPSAQHSILSAQHSILSTQHSTSSAQHSIPSAQHSIPSLSSLMRVTRSPSSSKSPASPSETVTAEMQIEQLSRRVEEILRDRAPPSYDAAT